jgi:hypothetical protein
VILAEYSPANIKNKQLHTSVILAEYLSADILQKKNTLVILAEYSPANILATLW